MNNLMIRVRDSPSIISPPTMVEGLFFSLYLNKKTNLSNSAHHKRRYLFGKFKEALTKKETDELIRLA